MSEQFSQSPVIPDKKPQTPSPESMKMRNDLMEKGADMNSVASGLAGVNTEETQKFRKLHFNKDATLWAKSYANDWGIINGTVCQYGFEGSA